ncbi:MAG: 50S ribosomal protein L5 [Proteobacteria bacterium]|nr:50S ribosomal protein L5 [Pseudomonadota bacterium]
MSEKTNKPRLQVQFEDEIVAQLKEELGVKSVMRVPKMDRVVLNIGLGAAVANPKIIEDAVTELGLIAGQKPLVTKARKSIANFKLREGMPIGVTVTLRRARMYEFLDRLINVALPRVRDFRGLNPKAFDGCGNYTIGLRDHSIFPEVDLDRVDVTKGMSVSLVTTAVDDNEGRSLLKHFGLPLRD